MMRLPAVLLTVLMLAAGTAAADGRPAAFTVKKTGTGPAMILIRPGLVR